MATHNQHLAWKPLAHNFGVEIVTIILEPSRLDWNLHKQLLRYRSAYFANAFKNDPIQNDVRTSHTLHDMDVEAFCIFVIWLYQSNTKRVDEWYENHSTQISTTHGTSTVDYVPIPGRAFPLGLVRFYILANKLLLGPDVRLGVINGIIRHLNPNPANRFGIDPMLRTTDFTFALDNLPIDDPLRLLITDLACISFVDRKDRPTFAASDSAVHSEVLMERNFLSTLQHFTRESTHADGTQTYIDPLLDFWQTPHHTIAEIPRYQIGFLAPSPTNTA